jgi:hypothetical protein
MIGRGDCEKEEGGRDIRDGDAERGGGTRVDGTRCVAVRRMQDGSQRGRVK